jgi:hypothetical protein
MGQGFTNLVFVKYKIDINLVFTKYKIDPNLCLENTFIFQIYFNWETFSKITLKYVLFYKNGPWVVGKNKRKKRKEKVV